MIQQQIEKFTSSLQNIATEYSDPAIILQHMPVLKDFPLLKQNPEYLFYGLGGIAALFVLKKVIFKRRKSRVNTVSMVMPKPYEGDPEQTETPDPDSLHESVQIPVQNNAAEPLRIPKTERTALQTPDPAPRSISEPTVRSPAQPLDDVGAISFTARPALTPDEARLRVIVQSVLNEFGAGYMIMARTSLAALLEPGREAVGPERANALGAIEGKCIDFGIFDRVGRCIIALDVANAAQEIGTKAMNRAIVHSALKQAGLPIAKLALNDTPADIRVKIGSFLKPTGQAQTQIAPQAQMSKPSNAPRPGRPTRPARPNLAAALAAE